MHSKNTFQVLFFFFFLLRGCSPRPGATKVNRSGSAKKWHSCLERQEATEPFSSSRHFQKTLQMPRRGGKGMWAERVAQPKALLGDLRSEYFCAGDGAWKSSLIRWPLLLGLCLLVSHP